jgi:hypothetical protein
VLNTERAPPSPKAARVSAVMHLLHYPAHPVASAL